MLPPPMNNNKPLLLVFPFGLLSHYLRCLVLADHLKEHFKIMFAGNSTFTSFIEERGYTTFTCRSFNSGEAIAKLTDFDFSWLSEKEVEANYLEQVNIIEQYKPAAVLGDAMPTLNMAAEYTGVPLISLVNGYMTKYYAGYRTLPKKHRINKFLNLLPDNVKQYFTIKGEKIAFTQIHKPFKKIRARYALQQKGDYLDEMEGDYNFICDLPELFPQIQIPENYKIVGPLVYNRYKDCTIALNSNKETIYVSMGSSGNWKDVLFLNNAYFSRYNIVCSGDKNRNLDAAHIVHADFIDAEKILPLSSLVICHGGNGTIYQALLYKVPLLCLPFHFEQEWNTDVLVSMGLAKTASGTCTQDDFKSLISECINSQKSEKRQDISERIKGFIKIQPDFIKPVAARVQEVRNHKEVILLNNNNSLIKT